MAASGKKYSRLDFRIAPESKEILAQAAALSGQELSEFVLSRVLPEARRLVADEHRVVLRHEAWNKFADLLEAPPKASKRLKAALRKSSESDEA